jgi:sugar-specific transcriptional regulator TrmB
MQQSLPVNKYTNVFKNQQNASVTASIIDYLVDFGLSEKEAKIYYILSRLGSASANQITNASEFNRLQIYRAVKGLLDRGLVEISLERPRRYTPLKIEHAISLLEQEAANRMVQLESKKPLLLEKWSQLTEFPISRQNYTFRIIQGSRNVFKFAVILGESAEKEIDVILRGDGITQWVLHGADDSLQTIAQKPVITRAITEFNKINITAVQRFLEFCDLRHVASINTASVMSIDKKEVLICLNGNNLGIPENAIWTNHPELVEIINSFFNAQWSNAEPAKTALEKLRIKRENGSAA